MDELGPRAVAPQGSSVYGISRQEHWTGLPLPPPGDLPHPGIESVSPALAGRFFTTEPPGKPISYSHLCNTHTNKLYSKCLCIFIVIMLLYNMVLENMLK